MVDVNELLGPGEVARLLGISRQRLHTIRHDPALDFPKPAQLTARPAWVRAEIEAYKQTRNTKPGPKDSPQMINLEFLDKDGNRVGVAYDAHPRSQEDGPVLIPPGAVRVVVWLGTRPVNGVQ